MEHKEIKCDICKETFTIEELHPTKKGDITILACDKCKLIKHK